MKSVGRRWAAATIGIALLVAVGVSSWSFVRRTRPDAVAPRLIEALIERHPGTRIDAWSDGLLHTALASGLYVDVRLFPVFDACRADRTHCSDAIDRALRDVDQVIAASRDPRRAMLAAMVIGDATPGFRFGFVTDPLIGSLEVRYALTSGVASTFVTAGIADRLGLTRAALKDAAIAQLRSDRTVDLVPLAGSAAPAIVYRVRSSGDAVASLLDRDRMKRFAERLGATRLYAAVPAPDTLYLAKADDAGATALTALLSRGGGRPDLLAYDTEPAEGTTLSAAATTR